jgi:hypothetical protein
MFLIKEGKLVWKKTLNSDPMEWYVEGEHTYRLHDLLKIIQNPRVLVKSSPLKPSDERRFIEITIMGIESPDYPEEVRP